MSDPTTEALRSIVRAGEGRDALRRVVAAKYTATVTTPGGLVRPKTAKQREIDAAVCEAVIRFAFDHTSYGTDHLAPFGLETTLREEAGL